MPSRRWRNWSRSLPNLTSHAKACRSISIMSDRYYPLPGYGHRPISTSAGSTVDRWFLPRLERFKTEIRPLFEKLAAAAAQLPVQLVMSMGGGSLQLDRLAGDPIVVPFAPQLELLQRARLTVTHGGLNTVMESLCWGVPLVAVPIANDQPGIAARVQWHAPNLAKNVRLSSNITAETLPDSDAQSASRCSLSRKCVEDAIGNRTRGRPAVSRQVDRTSHQHAIARTEWLGTVVTHSGPGTL